MSVLDEAKSWATSEPKFRRFKDSDMALLFYAKHHPDKHVCTDFELHKSILNIMGQDIRADYNLSLFTFELTSSLLHNLWKRFGWDANYPAIGINDSILQLCLTQNFSLLVNTTQGGFGITPSNIRKVIAKNWLYRTTRTGIKIHAIPVNLFERETRFLDNLKHGSLTNFFDVQ